MQDQTNYKHQIKTEIKGREIKNEKQGQMRDRTRRLVTVDGTIYTQQ